MTPAAQQYQHDNTSTKRERVSECVEDKHQPERASVRFTLQTITPRKQGSSEEFVGDQAFYLGVCER